MVTLGPTNMSRVQAGGMGIEIDMTPSPVILVAAFNKFGLDIRSFREPLKRSIQQVVAPSLRQNFDVGGRPQWQALSPKTVAAKGGNTAPLIRSGKLKRKAGQLNVWNIDGLEGVAKLQMPNDVWYGAVHQEGAGSTFDPLGGDAFGSDRGYVPQRIWAVIQPEDEREIEQVFEDWLDERRVRAGL